MDDAPIASVSKIDSYVQTYMQAETMWPGIEEWYVYSKRK